MATFIAIPAKAQSKTAMRKVLDYVTQFKKTAYMNPDAGRQYKLISGQDCMPETAYKEFMNTKGQYRKASGVFYKHYIQSFKPDCGATPELIHRIGALLAKEFSGYEVVIATHIDADHWHTHFIVNSVSCETGLKIQINKKGGYATPPGAGFIPTTNFCLARKMFNAAAPLNARPSFPTPQTLLLPQHIAVNMLNPAVI